MWLLCTSVSRRGYASRSLLHPTLLFLISASDVSVAVERTIFLLSTCKHSHQCIVVKLIHIHTKSSAHKHTHTPHVHVYTTHTLIETHEARPLSTRPLPAKNKKTKKRKENNKNPLSVVAVGVAVAVAFLCGECMYECVSVCFGGEWRAICQFLYVFPCVIFFLWTWTTHGKHRCCKAQYITVALVCHRCSSFSFAVLYGWWFLWDASHYNNHYYLIVLLGFLFVVTDAHSCASLTALQNRRSHSKRYFPSHLHGCLLLLVWLL